MIKLIVNKQELSIVTQKVVSGTHNYLTVKADFKGGDWTGLRKWVHFTMGPYSYILPMANDEITEDAHLDLTEGTWEVYVHGNLLTDDEVVERITTDIKYLYVDAPHDGHPFPPLTPDYEEMLANQVAEANEIAKGVRDDADAGKFDGATYLPAVSEEGIISWTNDREKPNPTPQNIKGPKGDTGDSGVYIGTTEPTDPVKNVWINPEGGVGKVIVSVEQTGTHMPGTYDTYTFNFSDGTSLTFQIYNGADGSGIGDMIKSVYDPNNNATDIFAYVDNAVEGKADLTDLATVATSGDYNDLTNKPTIPVLPDVDTEMSGSSTNPVQNRVIKAYIDAHAESFLEVYYEETTYQEILDAIAAGKIPFLRASGYVLLSGIASNTISFTGVDAITAAPVSSVRIFTVNSSDEWERTSYDIVLSGNVDTQLNAASQNPVTNAAIVAALNSKQNTLTIDSAMSNSSENPVQNKAIKQYIDSKSVDFVTETINLVPSTNPPPASTQTSTTVIVPQKTGYAPIGFAFTKIPSFIEQWNFGMFNCYSNVIYASYTYRTSSNPSVIGLGDFTAKVLYIKTT